jgi:hypothetical protein
VTEGRHQAARLHDALGFAYLLSAPQSEAGWGRWCEPSARSFADADHWKLVASGW